MISLHVYTQSFQKFLSKMNGSQLTSFLSVAGRDRSSNKAQALVAFRKPFYILGELTPDLFAPAPRRGVERLMVVIDQINQKEGRGAVRIGSVPKTPTWAMRREMLSQSFTTRWEVVIGRRGSASIIRLGGL